MTAVRTALGVSGQFYPIQDSFLILEYSASPEGSDIHDQLAEGRRLLCTALRSLVDCLAAVDDQCRSVLSYHSSRRLISSRLRQCHCSSSSTNNASSHRQLQSAVATNTGRRSQLSSVINASSCRPAVNSANHLNHSALCVVYGDPHIRAFDGHFQTCHVLGTWPLVDNEYLTVQITNSHMGWANGTAVAKVAVIVKPYGDCAAPDGQHLTYFADQGRLPLIFDDATTPLSGVEIVETVPAELVQVHIHHVSTVVSVRLVGRYYTVSVLQPSTLTTRSDLAVELASTQLCQSGCPHSETVNLATFFRQTARRQNKAKRTTGRWDRKIVIALPVAVRMCGDAVGLSGYLTDSCVFDLLNTGDLSFAQLSAKSALADVRRVELTVAVNNGSFGATVVDSFRPDVTSSVGMSPRLTVRWLSWLIFVACALCHHHLC